jgi:hypothetical protein
MTKRRQRKSLHHGAVERELRRLTEMGAAVENQRNMIRSLLVAVARKHGYAIDLTKYDREMAKGGTVELEPNPLDTEGIRIRFVPPAIEETVDEQA